MIKIMFVCHGNICRSPMAEFIMKSKLRRAGISDKAEIFSCATSAEEIWCGVGNPMYPAAKAELTRNGVPFSERRAVQLRADDYDKYDLFVGMDEANIRNMKRIFGADRKNKIRKLMDFTDKAGADVADPWYSDRFDITFRDIDAGCDGLISHLGLLN